MMLTKVQWCLGGEVVATVTLKEARWCSFDCMEEEVVQF